MNQFRAIFLPTYPTNPPHVIIDGNDPGIDGINDPDGPFSGTSIESYLDVEWAGAVAPNATIDLVIAADTALESGGFLAAEHAVYDNVAPILSSSIYQYGCEQQAGAANAFIESLWEQAAAQGITVIEAAGDSGSAGCDSDSEPYAENGLGVNNWASTPFNVALGGTDFYYSDYNSTQSVLDSQLATYWSTTPTQLPAVSLLQRIPEQPWNNSQFGLDALNYYDVVGTTTIGAGSGGATNAAICGGNDYGLNGYCSSTASGYPKPSWQTAAEGIGVPNDGVRDLPDVSLFAADGANYSFLPICADDGDCQPPTGSNLVQITGVGGTSAAAPAFAGIMALVDEKYNSPQGLANYVLYPLKAQYPAAFQDVIQGTNSVPCESGTANCIAAPAGSTIVLNGVTEGQIGNNSTDTPDYNAAAGYTLATGLGSVDAANLVNDWNKVSFATSATTLTATPPNGVSLDSIPHGTPITISGTVTGSGTPGGDVALIASGTEPLQQGLPVSLAENYASQTFFTLSGGSYSGSVSYLPGGTYNIWGQYSGDGTNGMSSSTPPVQITVNPEASGIYFAVRQPTTFFTAASLPVTTYYGMQLDLSAQVAPSADVANLQACQTTAGVACPVFGAPTGTVIFSDNGSAINTAVVNAEGDAEYNAPFAIGAHSVTASYSGDNSYNASTATAIPFTVIKDNPYIVLHFSAETTSGYLVNGPDQPTVVTVQIENDTELTFGHRVAVAPPTGTVTLSSSLAGLSGTATLSPAVDPLTNANEGVATFTVPAGSVSGNIDIDVTIQYNGDSNYNVVTDNTSVAILSTSGDGGLTSAVAASMSGTISPTTSVTISGTVTGQSGHAAPTGVVYAYSAGYYCADASIVPGSGDSSTFTITLNSQNLFQGSNLITLQYFGDKNYNPSAYTLSTPISNPLSDFSMVPESTIVAVAAPGDSGMVPINITSMNGFSGTVAVTATSSAGVGIQIPASVTLTSGGSQTFNLALTPAVALGSGTFNVLLTRTNSTGKYIHTLSIELVVGGSVAATPAIMLSNVGNISVARGATTGNTSTITVTQLAGFTGTVDLSCSVSGPVGATSPATCGLASSSVTISSGAQTDLLTVTTTSTTTAGDYTVTVTGTSAGITSQTTTVDVTVNTAAAGAFALSNSGNIQVTAGANSGNTSTISLTPSNGFTGTVNLTCSVTTSMSNAIDMPTCSLPASVNITGTGAATATLTVNSTAATTASLERRPQRFLTGGERAAVAIVFLFMLPALRRMRRFLFGVLIMIAVAGASSCSGGGGGNGGGGGGGNSGTTPGTYSVTVTGTDAATGKITAQTTVALSVN